MASGAAGLLGTQGMPRVAVFAHCFLMRVSSDAVLGAFLQSVRF